MWVQKNLKKKTLKAMNIRNEFKNRKTRGKSRPKKLREKKGLEVLISFEPGSSLL